MSNIRFPGTFWLALATVLVGLADAVWGPVAVDRALSDVELWVVVLINALNGLLKAIQVIREEDRRARAVRNGTHPPRFQSVTWRWLFC